MIRITDKKLFKAIDRINGLAVKDYTALIEDFAKKQPALIKYIVDNTESLSKPAARDEAIYMISVVWQCYLDLKRPIGKITTKDIAKTEKQQMRSWEKLAAITDEKEEDAFAKKFITQPQIWAFLNEIVLPEDKKKSNFNKKTDVALAYALVNLVVSLLDQKVASR